MEVLLYTLERSVAVTPYNSHFYATPWVVVVERLLCIYMYLSLSPFTYIGASAPYIFCKFRMKPSEISSHMGQNNFHDWLEVTWDRSTS